MASSDSLILELQQQALDATQPVTVLLRRALLVATKLDLTDDVKWIERELSGWPAEEVKDIPQWRKVRGEVIAKNPVRGWIPVLIANSEEAEILCVRPMREPAAELEAFIQNKPGSRLHVSYAPEGERSLQRSIGYEFPIRCEIGLSGIKRILDEIRNMILRWSLALEKAGIRGEGMSFTSDEKKQAISNNVHIHLYDGDANIGSITGIGDTTNIVSNTSNTIKGESIAQLVSEVTKYASQLGLRADQKKALDGVLGELEAEAAHPAPEPKKVMGLAKKLVGFVGRTANTVIEAGIKAYIEGWIKAHGGA